MQITYQQFERLHKVTYVMEKFSELFNLVRNLSNEEYKLLISSLEMSLKESEESND